MSRVINSTVEITDWRQWDRSVRKIVLGVPPMDDETNPLAWTGPQPDFAQFAELTHLYLWQIEGLTSLGSLPDELKCLDVRGCGELTELPALPPKLETLDIGLCAGLVRLNSQRLPNLRRFYFNGCKNKKLKLGAFLEMLEDVPMEEIDGSEAPAVTSLEQFPKGSLRKLVLKKCLNLADLTNVGEFGNLKHLDLSGCKLVAGLPDLPPAIQYLALHGADNLTDFMGQNVSVYDRGTEEDANVAKAFLTRKKFGDSLAIMPHAKLLLMGDGRVGKTTLVKGLRWGGLSSAERREPKNASLKPVPNERYTNTVEFAKWTTGLSLPEKDAKALAAAAAAKNLAVPKTIGVRIWDFGGQEIYHNTHRIFAGAGSVFLLVWCDQPLSNRSLPPGVRLSEEVWNEVNAPKSIDYWLDYIYSLREDSRIALVYTVPHRPGMTNNKPDWRDQTMKYKDARLESFHLDCLDDDYSATPEYRRLAEWIRHECGHEAAEIGVRQPKFFEHVANLIDGWLDANSTARASGSRPTHLLRDREQWDADINAMYAKDFPNGAELPDADDIETITKYLHATGHLFRIRSPERESVLVDQQWAAGVIYSLLDIEEPLWAIVSERGGFFSRRQLENDPNWQGLRNDAEREQILEYMIHCGVVTRLVRADRSAAGEDIFLASDKWLLPPYEDVSRRVGATVEFMESQHGIETHETFAFEKVELTEFDFRRLQVTLAREFGTGAIYFRNGVFAHQEPEWCFLLNWQPKKNFDGGKAGGREKLTRPEVPYLGFLDARLIARKAESDLLFKRITDVFYSATSPLRDSQTAPTRLAAQPIDFREMRLRPLRPDEYDIGFSSSGADSIEAKEIYDALSGVAVDWYAAKRPEKSAMGVFDYMVEMVSQPCIVILLSERYVKFDPESWHCAWELADAVTRLADGRRRPEQTIVIYKNNNQFDSRRAEEPIYKLFKQLEAFYEAKFKEKSASEWESFDDDRKFAVHFSTAARNCRTFFATKTTKGSYFRAGESREIAEEVRKVVFGAGHR